MQLTKTKVITNDSTLPTLPFSLEAEQSVIGAILLDNSALEFVAEILPHENYFYLAIHKLIYSCLLKMFLKGSPIDFITVLDNLKTENDLDTDETKQYLISLLEIVPSISGVSNYANIIRNNYDIRNLIIAAKEIIDDASSGGPDSNQLLDIAEQKILDIRQGKNLQGLSAIKSSLLDTLDKLDFLNSTEGQNYLGIKTGIHELDETLTGLNKSDLLLLAARPGMGKTSFALNIAKHAAGKEKKKVAFFSLEMTKEQLTARLLSTEALIEGSKLKTGKLNNKEWEKLVMASNELSGYQLYLDDTPGINVPEMKAKLRRLKNVDLVIIDYLQLMSSAKKIESRVQEISEITRSLKIMAKELNVPILTLSQLSRASEQRTEHRPVLSDLRDSGSIEQDADIVLFLYRENYYKQSPSAEENYDNNSAECIIAKNRHGEVKTVPLHWQPEYMRFTAKDNSHYTEF